jgi:hypothetical protein
MPLWRDEMIKIRGLLIIFVIFISGCKESDIESLVKSNTKTPIGGGSGRVLLFAEHSDNTLEEFSTITGENNLFISNWDGKNIFPLTTSGIPGLNPILEDISPNKTKLVLSTSSHPFGASDDDSWNIGNLFIVDVSTPGAQPTTLILDGYFHSGAKWVNEDKIIYAGVEDNYLNLYSINIDGSEKTILYKPEYSKNIAKILHASETGIYWLDMFDNIWQSNIDGTNPHILRIDNWGRGDDWFAITTSCEITQDGKWLVWKVNYHKGRQTDSIAFYMFSLSDGKIYKILESSQPSDIIHPYKILNSNNILVVVPLSVWDNNAYYLDTIHIFIIEVNTLETREINIEYKDHKIFLPKYSLSPDGRLLIINGSYSDKENPNKHGGNDTKVINLDTNKITKFNRNDFENVIWLE